jgi:hypothetical protein
MRLVTYLSQLINCAPKLPFGSSSKEMVKSFGSSVLVERKSGDGMIKDDSKSVFTVAGKVDHFQG